MRGILALSALSLVACGGVGGAVDGNSGGDDARDRANGFFVDRGTVTDRLDGDDGDNTDWKYVDINDAGRLTIKVVVDSPERLKGARITLHDRYGERLDQRVISATTGSGYTFDAEVEKLPAKFFVRVYTREGTSAYSIGARLAYAPRAAPPQPVASPSPPPEPVVERKRPRKRRRAKRRAKPKPKPAPVVKPTRVKGKIVRMVPGSGYVKLTIRLPAGSTLTKAARGRVIKNGERQPWRVSILKVSGNKVTAKVNQSAGSFTGNLAVVFDVRQ